MKLRFYNRIYWRGLLPGLWLSWEETTMTVVLYLDGPEGEGSDHSILSVQADLEVPRRVEKWLLPRWERWVKERSWIT